MLNKKTDEATDEVTDEMEGKMTDEMTKVSVNEITNESANELTNEMLIEMIMENDDHREAALLARGDAVRRQIYGDAVYIRGLIEFTNYCGNNCYYCGIRAGNRHAQRYRLDTTTVLDCCAKGYALGFRTFVLQGGEDAHFTDDRICALVSAIKTQHPDCAVTLSVGEKPYASYKAYFDAGADRYLLRHETANAAHYAQLHPGNRGAEDRKVCLWHLKEIGFQVGAGFMVGAPFQQIEHMVEDLRFLEALQPDMIGVGPFIPHGQTPFAGHTTGDLHTCLRMIAILRIMFPHALLPATTALASIHLTGREMALKAGANVLMPNLSPAATRSLYTLYNNKAHTGVEAAEQLAALRERVREAGYTIVTDIGHVKRKQAGNRKGISLENIPNKDTRNDDRCNEDRRSEDRRSESKRSESKRSEDKRSEDTHS